MFGSEDVKGYCIDIVMCIDMTGSMRSLINDVKEKALAYPKEIVRQMEIHQKNVEKLRIKVIAFGDYESDSPAMVESKFFDLLGGQEAEEEAFTDFVNKIYASGGGDESENALEAIALALKSDWVQAPKSRHIILVFTDTGALELGARSGFGDYDTMGYPADITELSNWYGGGNQELKFDPAAGRLVLFAPMDKSPWEKVSKLDLCFPTNTVAGGGMEDTTFAEIINMLVSSITKVNTVVKEDEEEE